jgi:hypothetical protein
MNFNIASVGAAAAKPVAPSGPNNRNERAAPTSRSEEDSVVVDALPGSPPPEVHDAMAVAASSYEKLQSQGRELSFQIDEGTGKLHIAVHDLNGQVLFTVPPSKVLDVAAGGSLD